MAKINVYLPDDLAARVKGSSIPVSRICQAALAEALDAIQESSGADYESLPAETKSDLPLNSHVSVLVRNAYEAARRRGSDAVDTGDLLQGLLDEDESLILKALGRAGFTRTAIAASLAQFTEIGPAHPNSNPQLSARARAVLDLATEEAKRRGFTVVNGSHMMRAFLSDPGPAGQALRAIGVPEVINPVVIDILNTAVAYGRATSPRSPEPESVTTLAELAERIERLERIVAHQAAS